MNKRQKKKRDKEAIMLARKIIYCVNGHPTYWRCNSETTRSDMKYGAKYHNEARYDFKNELQSKEMLLKVCRKCLLDKFPLEDYYLFEIPYSDQYGWIMDFVNREEYESCHKSEADIKIHEIDFWCPFDKKLAIPQGLDNNSNQYDCNNCFEALYDD